RRQIGARLVWPCLERRQGTRAHGLLRGPRRRYGHMESLPARATPGRPAVAVYGESHAPAEKLGSTSAMGAAGGVLFRSRDFVRRVSGLRAARGKAGCVKYPGVKPPIVRRIMIL